MVFICKMIPDQKYREFTNEKDRNVWIKQKKEKEKEKERKK